MLCCTKLALSIFVQLCFLKHWIKEWKFPHEGTLFFSPKANQIPQHSVNSLLFSVWPNLLKC